MDSCNQLVQTGFRSNDLHIREYCSPSPFRIFGPRILNFLGYMAGLDNPGANAATLPLVVEYCTRQHAQ